MANQQSTESNKGFGSNQSQPGQDKQTSQRPGGQEGMDKKSNQNKYEQPGEGNQKSREQGNKQGQNKN